MQRIRACPEVGGHGKENTIINFKIVFDAIANY